MDQALKKVLICSHAMELGGAEKALLGLLESFDTKRYQVDLFLLRHQGELMDCIPEEVRMLPEKPEYACLAVPIGTVLRQGQLRVALGRVRGKLAAARRNRQLGFTDSDVALEYSHKYVRFAMPPISEEEYDLAVSFLTPHYFAAEKVRAKRRIAWIHTDYSRVQVDRASQLDMWAKYDAIASISEEVSRSFVQVFPELADRLILIANSLPLNYMHRLEDAFSVEQEMPKDDSIRLLSIGRFCTAKNFDNVPEICRLIREQGLDVKWYLIGYGGDEALIRERIAAAGMEEYVKILGKKENPYPYLKGCDVYVQPSRYEGKCVSVLEAQSLHKPVVIAAYATAASQLRDGVDGVILPQENQAFAEGLCAVLTDRALQDRLVSNTYAGDYANTGEVKKLCRIIEQETL